VKILITGASGQVGSALRRELALQHELICPTRRELDLADPDHIRQVLRRIQPEVLINCGAFTEVDAAESSPDTAWRINAEAPGIMATEMESLGGAMLHYSTDYVFDGHLARPYRESDPTGPLSTYGRSKLGGEQAVDAACGAALTLRLSWVYSEYGHNFIHTMLRLARQRKQLSVVDDQFGTPTWALRIAQATHMVLRAALQDTAGPHTYLSQRRGCYHLSAVGTTSWHDYAALILQQAERRDIAPLARLERISSRQWSTPARRPFNSRLDCGKFGQTFHWTPPAWEPDVIACLARMLDSPSSGA
jgi:dTDP-4-dehydrorhamnose reductase